MNLYLEGQVRRVLNDACDRGIISQRYWHTLHLDFTRAVRRSRCAYRAMISLVCICALQSFVLLLILVSR